MACGAILNPKWPNFDPFLPKMTYFDQIDNINDTFDQIYVHKPDWNHLKNFKGKIFDQIP